MQRKSNSSTARTGNSALFGAVALATALLAGCAPSAAQPAKSAEDPCASGSAAALGACMSGRLDTARARMETALAAALAAQPSAAEALRAEQQAWSAYYDVACGYFRDRAAFGREGALVQAPTCQTSLLNARAEHLERLFDRDG